MQLVPSRRPSAGLGEEIGVIDLLVVERRQDAGSDTNEFGVCVAQTHGDVDAVLLIPM